VLWFDTTETTKWQQKMEGLRYATIEPGGTIVIGQQQGLERTGFHSEGLFYGLIDEVRMWSDWKWVKNPNKPPSGGWLSISNGNPDSPFEGYGMTSSFTLGTDDWEDDYTPDRKRIFTFFFKSMLN
jgi:hypothetical protein